MGWDILLPGNTRCPCTCPQGPHSPIKSSHRSLCLRLGFPGTQTKAGVRRGGQAETTAFTWAPCRTRPSRLESAKNHVQQNPDEATLTKRPSHAVTSKARRLVFAHISIGVHSPELVRCQEPGPFHLVLCCDNDNGQSLFPSPLADKEREEGQEDTHVP